MFHPPSGSAVIVEHMNLHAPDFPQIVGKRMNLTGFVGKIGNIAQKIHQQRNRGKAVLLVSFELDEVMSLSDRIDVIFEGKIVGSVKGSEANENQLGLMMAGGGAHA